MKKFKFEYLSGPFSTYTEGETAKAVRSHIAALSPYKKIVSVSYKDFAYHELDDTLQKAWETAAIGYDHPLSRGTGEDSRIRARGYFVCLKTLSDKSPDYFTEQSKKYHALLESKGLADF